MNEKQKKAIKALEKYNSVSNNKREVITENIFHTVHSLQSHPTASNQRQNILEQEFPSLQYLNSSLIHTLRSASKNNHRLLQNSILFLVIVFFFFR